MKMDAALNKEHLLLRIRPLQMHPQHIHLFQNVCYLYRDSQLCNGT